MSGLSGHIPKQSSRKDSMVYIVQGVSMDVAKINEIPLTLSLKFVAVLQ